jgi:glutathione S-transferase
MVATVYGVALSPYVRKVLIVLEIKNISYRIEPVNPFDPPKNFNQISPLNKIPVFADDNITVADSAVICDYLERQYPHHPIYPSDNVQRAQALWFEVYAGNKLINLLGNLFFERIVKPRFLDQPTDNNVIDSIIADQLPSALNYLEEKVMGEFLVGDQFSIADISICTTFLNASYADFEIASDRWPALANYVNNILRLPSFVKRKKQDIELLNEEK